MSAPIAAERLRALSTGRVAATRMAHVAADTLRSRFSRRSVRMSRHAC